MTDFLTEVLFWNARGVSNKKIELQRFLTSSGIKVALISETHIKPHLKFKVP